MAMKLGLKPFVPDPRDLKFRSFRTSEPLPKHPASFGHDMLIRKWGMLGNDKYGDCVFAGFAHQVMGWNRVTGKKVAFNDECVLSDYAACTGFNPSDPDSDQGTDMREAAKYFQKTGIVDMKGNRHKIGAYLFISPQNYESFVESIWLFVNAGIGFNFPASAMNQFNQRKPWTVVTKSPIEGGHYVPSVAWRDTILDKAKESDPQTVTWSRKQAMSKAFYLKYNMQTMVCISEEMLTEGKSPEGFDLAALQSALRKL
jgi:hypothetical protein